MHFMMQFYIILYTIWISISIICCTFLFGIGFEPGVPFYELVWPASKNGSIQPNIVILPHVLIKRDASFRDRQVSLYRWVSMSPHHFDA